MHFSALVDPPYRTRSLAAMVAGCAAGLMAAARGPLLDDRAPAQAAQSPALPASWAAVEDMTVDGDLEFYATAVLFSVCAEPVNAIVERYMLFLVGPPSVGASLVWSTRDWPRPWQPGDLFTVHLRRTCVPPGHGATRSKAGCVDHPGTSDFTIVDLTPIRSGGAAGARGPDSGLPPRVPCL